MLGFGVDFSSCSDVLTTESGTVHEEHNFVLRQDDSHLLLKVSDLLDLHLHRWQVFPSEAFSHHLLCDPLGFVELRERLRGDMFVVKYADLGSPLGHRQSSLRSQTSLARHVVQLFLSPVRLNSRLFPRIFPVLEVAIAISQKGIGILGFRGVCLGESYRFETELKSWGSSYLWLALFSVLLELFDSVLLSHLSVLLLR